MRKFLIAFLSLIAIACFGAAVACNNDEAPTYYTLTYSACDGVEIICDISNGYYVKSGYTVSFTLEQDESATGSPVVTCNTSTLTPDKSGVYSFKMTRDTTIDVSGVSMPNTYTVEFNKDDYRITYNVITTDLNGSLSDGYKVLVGTQISFTVDISSYYDQSDLAVYQNTQKIIPDNDGVYTFNVMEKTAISVKGLVLEETFIERGDGSGTEADPYMIRTPSDLYAMFAYINSDFNGAAFNTCSYALANNIDMKGEVLYTIADGYSTTNSYFYGTFNGNGYTISNFTINGTFIDQESYDDVNIPYIGLFGVVASYGDYQAGVYNLNLDSFEINADASVFDYSDSSEISGTYIGAIAGFTYGATISGCSVTNAQIHVISDDDYVVTYVGGLVGCVQSYYDSSYETSYYASVNSCYTENLYIENSSGYCYAMGGIVGVLAAYTETCNAYILNSYFNGTVQNGMRAGGIVGMASYYTSVIGCYSIGRVEAMSDIAYSASVNELYCYAYGGGIVGFADYNTVVADCFALTGKVFVSTEASKDKYAKSDDIIGYCNLSDGVSLTPVNITLISLIPTTATTCISLNNYWSSTFTQATFTALKWEAADWTYNGEGYPSVNLEGATKTITVTINLGENTKASQSTYSGSLTDIYAPLSYWYSILGGIDEYLVADSGYRSYGYFFDADLTQAVPYGFVPTHDITLYTGFADYSQVVGKYYFVSKNASGAYIQLDDDGTLWYYNGARSFETTYKYDGTTIYLLNTYIAMLDFSTYPAVPGNDATDEEKTAFQKAYYLYYYANNSYFSFKATLGENNAMYIVDNTFYVVDEDDALEDDALTAIKESESFAYGSYYNGDVTVTFNKNGSGTFGDNAFTYIIDGSTITVTYTADSSTAEFTIGTNQVISSGVTYTALDKYVGTWETAANRNEIYTFDGKGNYTYSKYSVNSSGEKVSITSSTGKYSTESDRLVMDNAAEASFDAEGFLTINDKTFYRENSFVGTWSYMRAMYPIELQLGGIGSDNFGNGVMTIGNNQTTYNVTYETYVENGIIYLDVYSSLELMASLYYNVADKTLIGVGDYRGLVFCVYDDFIGEWVTDNDDVNIISFNGLGFYNVRGSATTLARYGIVKVTDKKGKTYNSTYSLTDQTLTGTVTIIKRTDSGTESVDYTITYDEASGKITLSKDETDIELFERDNWYYVSLKDTAGNVYTFDGKGNAGKGTMTKTSSDDVVTTASYEISGDNLVLSGDIAGELTVDTNSDVFKLAVTGGDTITLTYATAFSGNWIISGLYQTATLLENTTSREIVIGEFGASKTAAGTFMGTNVTYTYDLDGNFVWFMYNNTKFYFNAFEKENGGYELALGITRQAESDYLICIEVTLVDKYYNKGEGTTFTLTDGATITYDGLGNSEYGGGFALYTYTYNGYNLYTYLTYKFNTFVDTTFVELRNSSSSAIYVFVETTNEDTTTYEIRSARYAFYLLTVTLDEDTGTTITFDGLGGYSGVQGTAKDSDGNVYTYTIDSYDGETRTYTLTMVCDGVEYTADVDFTNVKTTITMAPKSLTSTPDTDTDAQEGAAA